MLLVQRQLDDIKALLFPLGQYTYMIVHKISSKSMGQLAEAVVI